MNFSMGSFFSILSLLLLISGLSITFLWLKYSWSDKYIVNSKVYQGKDATRIILDNNNLEDVEIKSSWFVAKFWNHNQNKKTYRPRPWTHDRRSIWTMMEACQQAFVSTIRNQKKEFFGCLESLESLVQ